MPLVLGDAAIAVDVQAGEEVVRWIERAGGFRARESSVTVVIERIEACAGPVPLLA